MTPPVKTTRRAKSAAWVLILLVAAVAAAGMLLLSDLPFLPTWPHPYLSSLPLAMAGVGYALLQLHVRPDRTTLMKRLLLAAAFVVWAVNQLMPPGPLATFVGDAVIAAYVLDLYWLIQEQVAALNATGDSDGPRNG